MEERLPPPQMSGTSLAVYPLSLVSPAIRLQSFFLQ
jgi:hypothetical protein